VVGKGKRPDVKVVLQDLKSKNGTTVNYRKIHRRVLKSGDKICIGSTLLKYENRDLADQKFFEQINRLATIDTLTSLMNRFRITEILSEEISRMDRYPSNLSVLMIDIDDFKSLNDTYGHLTGDRAIQEVAAGLKKNLRKQDRAGRLGGEEFLVILPATSIEGAATLARRICRYLEKSVAKTLRLERSITVSIGVAACSEGGIEQDNLLDRADRALYRAKGRGKNRVELWRDRPSA
jgi:diguanylate cyclase (GGDEF)-like protein